MAAYVLMKKLEEDDKKVVYRFGPNENNMGIIEFDKIEKEFTILEKIKAINSDTDSIKYENWAAQKIVKIMYKENGIFPERMTVEF